MCHLFAREHGFDAYAAQRIEVDKSAVHRLHDRQCIEPRFIDVDNLARLAVRKSDPIAVQRMADVADEWQAISRIEMICDKFIGQRRKDIEGRTPLGVGAS